MRSFAEIYWYDFPKLHYQKVKDEITSKGKDYILKVDENEFIGYLIEKYRVEPLKILNESKKVSPPRKSKERRQDMFRQEFMSDAYQFTVTYPFKGHGELFKVQSNPCIISSYEINVNLSKQTVSYSFKIYNQDASEFNQTNSRCYSNAFANLNNINKNVVEFNRSYEQTVRSMFLNEKASHKKENEFFAAINVKVDPSTESVFSAPTIKKKIITQPKIEKNKEFNSVPTMSQEMYDDVLKVIYDSGKSMEKKPALYRGKDEEGLRDQFLFITETRYTGTTATGETFNRAGKADIILKYANDGTNLFIAECKFWHGASEYLKAISQLFDRYLTWRDSKVAVMIFVKNKDFSNILKTIKEETPNHNYFVRYKGDRGESSFSYDFHLKQDKDKIAQVEIMVFHFDKK
jgi:hypothetical protein